MNRSINSPFIIWTNYDSEGWHPTGYATEAEAVQAILAGTNGAAVLTQRLELGVTRASAEFKAGVDFGMKYALESLQPTDEQLAKVEAEINTEPRKL